MEKKVDISISVIGQISCYRWAYWISAKKIQYCASLLKILDQYDYCSSWNNITVSKRHLSLSIKHTHITNWVLCRCVFRCVYSMFTKPFHFEVLSNSFKQFKLSWSMSAFFAYSFMKSSCPPPLHAGVKLQKVTYLAAPFKVKGDC